MAGELYVAIRSKKQQLRKMLSVMQSKVGKASKWTAVSDFLYPLQYSLEPGDVPQKDWAAEQNVFWSAPEDTVVVFASMEPAELSTAVMDTLEAAVAAVPEAEIAVAAFMARTVGYSLYTFFSPQGSATLRPDNYPEKWFPADWSMADWTSYMVKDELLMGFPPEAKWVPVSDWLDIQADYEFDYDEDSST